MYEPFVVRVSRGVIDDIAGGALGPGAEVQAHLWLLRAARAAFFAWSRARSLRRRSPAAIITADVPAPKVPRTGVRGRFATAVSLCPSPLIAGMSPLIPGISLEWGSGVGLVAGMSLGTGYMSIPFMSPVIPGVAPEPGSGVAAGVGPAWGTSLEPGPMSIPGMSLLMPCVSPEL